MKQLHRPFQRYELSGKRNDIFIDLTKAPEVLERTTHTNEKKKVSPVYFFNRAVKRGDTVLLTGDKARFALMRNFPDDVNDPPHNKLGDGTVCVISGGTREYLHESEDVQTLFTESETIYRICLRNIPELEAQMTVSQMEDFGAAVKIELINASDKEREMALEFEYGGICIHGRTHTGAYFFLENDNYEKNQVMICDQEAIIENTGIPEQIRIWSVPESSASIKNQRAVLTQSFVIPAFAKVQKSFFVARLAAGTKHPEDVDAVIAEARTYAEDIGSRVQVDTPDEVLNAAFITSVYNMEYQWNGKAWVEGIHWWVAPWCQNYQLSAGITLGQYERVKKTIELIGNIKPCPAPGLNGAFKPMTNHIGVYTHGSEDGLPYFLYQLCQYYRATGDRDTILGLWEQLCLGIEKFYENRSDDNGFIDFHLGCNMFLYQADHLALPGNAASPTLFMAGIMGEMAQIAEELNKTADAARWREKEKLLYYNIGLLWNEEDECFYNHIDLQGVKHKALYYTDSVFPILYTSLPESVSRKSLDSLFRNMILETEDGRLLMKVGELKPDIFGNNHVSPTQMCEAARAFYAAGDYETATRLLFSVAYAATIYTESPGSFPERMDNDGKGEANYLFANPTGAFCYSFVSGLFGIDLLDGGKTVRCMPAFPDAWDHASLVLPYVSIDFKREKEGIEVTDTYSIKSSVPRTLYFKTSPYAQEIAEIRINGEEGAVTEGFGRLWGEGRTNEADTCFSVVLRYKAQEGTQTNRDMAGEKKESFPSGKRLEICGDMKSTPVSLKDETMEDSLTICSAWRNGPYFPDFSLYQDGENRVKINGITFDIRPSTESAVFSPQMIVLEYAHSDPYTNKLLPGGQNRRTVPLHGSGKALALLYMSECQSRNTSCQSGNICVKYISGKKVQIPLEVGKTIDTIYSHFATDTYEVYIPSELEKHPIHPGKDYANLYLLPLADGEELESITFSVELADIYFGLIGMSILN